MATNNIASSVSTAVQNAGNAANYLQDLAKNYGSMSDEDKGKLRSDPIGFFKDGYDKFMAGSNSGDTPTETVTEDTPAKEYTPREGQENFYAGDNTKDHSEELKEQYDQTAADQNAAVDKVTEEGIKASEAYQKQGLAEYERLRGVSEKDYRDAINERESVERNNGNRDGIGHSQYGNLEQAYSSRLDELANAENRLKTQVTRAVADARAQGDHEKANAILSTAQSKLQAIYEEQMRIDMNLRSNYEWQTEIDQDDKKIQADLDKTELDWQRSLGEALLKVGIIPGADILDSMHLSKETAQKLVKAARARGGSGGGSGSGGSGGGDTEPEPEPRSYLDNGLPDDAYGRFVSIQTDPTTANAGIANAYATGAWTDKETYDAYQTVAKTDYSKGTGNGKESEDYWNKYYG